MLVPSARNGNLASPSARVRLTLADFSGVESDGLEFCRRAYALFDQVKQAQDGANRLRLRESPVEKRLVEELLPICKYIQVRYCAGLRISVSWINGSQSFDARLEQRGPLVDFGLRPSLAYLEVTSAESENAYMQRSLLAQGKPVFAPAEGTRLVKGEGFVSKAVGFMNDGHMPAFAERVLEQLRKKAAIDYPPETSLVVPCTTNGVYLPELWS